MIWILTIIICLTIVIYFSLEMARIKKQKDANDEKWRTLQRALAHHEHLYVKYRARSIGAEVSNE